jgi:cyclophilin family peptidyl-prolyl cis-trans isomerase
MPLVSLILLALLQAAPPKQKPAPTPAAPPAVQPAPLQPAPGNPVAVISTTLGDITVELFKDKAPVSVENFLQYVKEDFYAGTIFHRVERHFVVQGGGYTPSMVEKPTRPPILNEATNGLRNLRGTLAMARRQQLRSATTQFYFNLTDNPQLDHRGLTPPEYGYAVFGRVLDGFDVMDKIGMVPTRSVGDFDGVPVEAVVIKGVRLR